MKILVVGCGSIGARHARNAAAIAGINVMICDQDPAKINVLSQELECPAFSDLGKALAEQPDGVIVAVPNAYHYAAALPALEAGAKVLVEKPLCHETDEARDLVRKGEDKLFVVCNMRYHAAIIALKEGLSKIGKPLFATAHFGNYLPNMRPGVDYSELYVARRETGGGVLMDNIHEIDYLQHLFGPVTSVSAQLQKLSDLNIETEDYAALQVTHESGVECEIHLDYLQQIKQRGCEIIGTDGTVIWRSTGKNPEHCAVSCFAAGTGEWMTLLDTTDLDHNQCYVSLIEAFCRSIRGQSDAILASGEEGALALACVHAAYKASDEKQRVNLKDFTGS